MEEVHFACQKKSFDFNELERGGALTHVEKFYIV